MALGAFIARDLAQHGARVACVATRAENAEQVVDSILSEGGSAAAFGCRVEQKESVTALFTAIAEQLGETDILVNNAGVSRPMLTLEMTEENWDLHMDVNCKSIFLCSQAASATNAGR